MTATADFDRFRPQPLEPLTAFRAFRKLIRDKEDTAQVFEIMRALSGRSIARGYDRMLKTMEGGRQAFLREELAHRLDDPVWLARFRPGTVGAAYRAFREARGFTAEGLAEEARKVAPLADAPHPVIWYSRRLRDVPDVVNIAQAARVPDNRMRRVGQRCDLARLVGQALGGEAARLAEVAVGGPDRAEPETGQPDGVVELVRQFLAQEGLTTAFHGLQHAVVTAGDRAPGQRPHDLEHLGGVLLVADQLAEGPQGGQRLERLGPEAFEFGGGGHAAVPEAPAA